MTWKMEVIKFCKKCDSVIFLPEDQEMKICPRCGEVFINNTYTVPSLDEEDSEVTHKVFFGENIKRAKKAFKKNK